MGLQVELTCLTYACSPELLHEAALQDILEEALVFHDG